MSPQLRFIVTVPLVKAAQAGDELAADLREHWRRRHGLIGDVRIERSR